MYGYLSPQLKAIVDQIVDELAKDEPSAAWEAIRKPNPKQKRRSVYEQAECYREAKKTLLDPETGHALRLDAIGELERLWDEGCIVAAHQLGKAYRDGLGVKVDADKAVEWFRYGAEAGSDYSEYALGELLLERGDTAGGVSSLTRAAKRGNQYAQYTLGKLYLLGREVPRDEEPAPRYLERAAAQGNVYAQYCLDHMEDRQGGGSVGLAVLRMLHSMGRIFREETAKDGTFSGMHVDSKRRELLEKRLAMGRKIDDHEDPENDINNQSMR